MKESWLNINAINDSIKAGFSILDKTVVSVMRGNAGAGGAMAAMASDLVWAHENVILNPHYKVPPDMCTLLFSRKRSRVARGYDVSGDDHGLSMLMLGVIRWQMANHDHRLTIRS